MEYKEYKASEGKVLFNIDNFTWGHQMLCSKDKTLNLIEINREDAEAYEDRYKAERERIMTDTALKEEYKVTMKNSPRMMRAAAAPVKMDDYRTSNGEYAFREGKSNEMKQGLLLELMAKGYNLNAAGTPESNIEEHIRGLLNE